MTQPEDHDPLWDPQLPADAELQHWQRLLAPYAAQRRAALAVAPLPASPTTAHRLRWPLRAMALAATLLLSLWGAHAYRLYWPDGQPWQLQSAQGQRELAPGERIETAAGEAAQLTVARIGQLQIAPGSALRLIDSRSGHHRIELEHGRVRARIWAPPGHFGIRSGQMQVIDLGCEFTLERQIDGTGSLSVLSGWVLQEDIGGRERLVPAGHVLQFSATSADTPLRHDAPPDFRSAVAALDRALQSAAAQDLDPHASAVARAARDEDQYTLMSLLLREPALANGPLYPRLAQALGVPATDSGHRAAWLRRDNAAIEAWWQRLPSQPKRWWTHWRDAY